MEATPQLTWFFPWRFSMCWLGKNLGNTAVICDVRAVSGTQDISSWEVECLLNQQGFFSSHPRESKLAPCPSRPHLDQDSWVYTTSSACLNSDIICTEIFHRTLKISSFMGSSSQSVHCMNISLIAESLAPDWFNDLGWMWEASAMKKLLPPVVQTSGSG